MVITVLKILTDTYKFADEFSTCSKIAVGSAFIADDGRDFKTCNNGGSVNCRQNKECYKAKVTGIYESCEETRKYCQSIHSEINMIELLKSFDIDPSKGTLYVTRYPCLNCATECAKFGFKRIVYGGKQKISDEVSAIFEEYNIEVEWYPDIDFEYNKEDMNNVQ